MVEQLLSLTDVLQALKVVIQTITLTEDITLTDIHSKQIGFKRTLSELLGLVEVLSKSMEKEAFEEVVTLLDSVVSAFPTILGEIDIDILSPEITTEISKAEIDLETLSPEVVLEISKAQIDLLIKTVEVILEILGVESG
jgi:hypothetical protein